MERLCDCHNDCLTKINNDKKLRKYLSSFKDNTVVLAVWTSKLDAITSINLMQKAKKLSFDNPNLLTSFEDLHFLTTENLSMCVELNPNFVGPVWNEDNKLAGGAYGTSGLTRFGELALTKFEQHGTIIDTAHCNEKSFIDIAKLSKKPIFCSHTACYELCNSPRNLKDYQLKIITESNGFVGICLVSNFLAGTNHCKLSDVLDHIEYFATKFSIDNIGFGLDFFGTKHLPKGIKNYVDLSKLKPLFLKRGFSEEEISKICYLNFENYLSRVNFTEKF